MRRAQELVAFNDRLDHTLVALHLHSQLGIGAKDEDVQQFLTGRLL